MKTPTLLMDGHPVQLDELGRFFLPTAPYDINGPHGSWDALEKEYLRSKQAAEDAEKSADERAEEELALKAARKAELAEERERKQQQIRELVPPDKMMVFSECAPAEKMFLPVTLRGITEPRSYYGDRKYRVVDAEGNKHSVHGNMLCVGTPDDIENGKNLYANLQAAAERQQEVTGRYELRHNDAYNTLRFHGDSAPHPTTPGAWTITVDPVHTGRVSASGMRVTTQKFTAVLDVAVKTFTAVDHLHDDEIVSDASLTALLDRLERRCHPLYDQELYDYDENKTFVVDDVTLYSLWNVTLVAHRDEVRDAVRAYRELRENWYTWSEDHKVPR